MSKMHTLGRVVSKKNTKQNSKHEGSVQRHENTNWSTVTNFTMRLIRWNFLEIFAFEKHWTPPAMVENDCIAIPQQFVSELIHFYWQNQPVKL